MFNVKMRYHNVTSKNADIKGMLKYLLIIVFLGCIGVSCNTINPVEPIPTYIHVDSFTFKNNPHVIGSLSLSHQITSVTAYYNNNPVGTFDLPTTFPVITNGTGKLSLFPGIAIDGLNNFLSPYPFYAPDTFTFAEQPGKIITHIPATKYFDSVKHFLDYDFELTGSINFTLVSGSPAMITTNTKSEVFEGNGSGKIYLSLPNDTLSESISDKTFNVAVGRDAYIEFNYNNDVPFYVGLKSSLYNSNTYFQRYLSGIYPSGGHWQKFYLAIKDFVGQYPGDYYTLYFKTYLPANTINGTVLLDNVRLVYF
jgi:hypothetical protein